ncbi:conserved hypothetical protein [Gammaproteobacteria bacterium]
MAIREKALKTSNFSIAILIFSSLFTFSYAASFTCAEATTLVEKAICSETPLSNLDDLLTQSYKKALASTKNVAVLKNQQKAWLLNVRNKCQDSACLVRVYNQRLTALNGINTSATPASVSPIEESASKNIVLGRCHMSSCWWWKVEKMEDVKSEKKGRLVKAYVKTTGETYSDSEVEKNGYPILPSKKSKWEEVTESFIFCSKKLPTYLVYEEEKKKFLATIPFDQSGESSGATEGIGNLYLYVCGSNSKFEISQEFLESSQILIEKPTDIFNSVK